MISLSFCRDNYDKEMKEKSGHRPKFSNKSRKPDQQTYVVPSARADTGKIVVKVILILCLLFTDTQHSRHSVFDVTLNSN